MGPFEGGAKRAILSRAAARAFLACLMMAAACVVTSPSAGAQVEQKQAEAAALKEKIAEQGRNLSLADEAYNQARLERQRIESEAASARDRVAAAEARWTALRTQLGDRVRMLYKHPGASLDMWLGAESFSELARGRKLGSSIVGADNELILQTERARHEVLTRARSLEGIRESASAKERELASRRAEVGSAISDQRALLQNVTAEIGDLIEAERERELAAAQARAAQAEQNSDGASAPAIGDATGNDDADEEAEDDDAAPTEPTGPPPPVKGGAGKAVQTAAAQIGKPYEWAAEGPDSYDCSGLTMYAWRSAGVSLPHSSQAQYSSLPHVARSQIRPGDLLFYGSPIHHVGIYEGGGVMINAPETGEFVRRDSIDRADYVGAARP